MTQDLSPAQRTLTVDVLGTGIVDDQVIRLPTEQAGDFAARSGVRLEIMGVVVHDVNAPRGFAVPQDPLTGDATAVATGNNLVIELIDGIEPTHTLVLAAFKAGTSVITGNKALIAVHGLELYTAAVAADIDLYCEVVIAGAIPVIYALRESITGGRITSALGIVDGTTNHILDEMNTKGLSFETTLTTAQELGYTEANPIADVDDLGAAAKAAVIASLAFHTRASLDDVSVEGIREVTTDDIHEARASGCEFRLLAIAQCRDDKYVWGVSTRVHPVPVLDDHPLASVHGAYNAVLVEAESAGRLMFYGQGVGEAPTTSAILSDVVAAAAHRVYGGQIPRESSYASLRVLDPEIAATHYRIQLRPDDAVGSLAAMASVFAENEASINSVCQGAYVTSNGSHDQATVTFVTHPVPVFRLDVAVKGLRDSDRIAEIVSIQRAEGE